MYVNIASYLQITKIRFRGEIGATMRRSDLGTWNPLKDVLGNRTDKQQSESFLEDQYETETWRTIQQYANRIEKIDHKLLITL